MGLKFAPRPVVPTPPPRPRRPREPKPAIPVPQVSPFGQRVRDTIGAGIRDEQHAVQVGQLVQEEFDRRFGAEYAQLSQTYRELKPQLDRANAQLRLYTRPSPATRARFDALTREAREAEQAFDRFTEEGYHTLLSEIRPLGGELRFGGGDAQVRGLVADVSRLVPRDWIEASNRGRRRLRTRIFGGEQHTMGQYDPRDGTISVRLLGRDPRDARSTALHELNHRMEDTTPRLVELEQQFFARRTAGEGHAPLPRYAKGTDGRPDDFVVPYMGRDYRPNGRGWGSFFELLSMGSEGVLLSASEMRRDMDMLRFILGLYAGV